MGSHPLNLALRFLLELAALVAMGFWGWSLTPDWARFLFAAGIPIFAAVVWGVFAVPGDPSRSGRAPMPTPGVLRLAIEIGFFAFAVWALFDLGSTVLGAIFAALVVVHYALSWDRIAWLLRR